MRRIQRGIDKKDLQSALKHGMRIPSHIRRKDGSPTALYTYKNITYIVNEATYDEVTSYAVPLKLDPVPLAASAQATHDLVKAQNKSNPSRWTSNTVLVVDVSGSMKEGDVWGTRDRLGAIWVSVALDFLAHRLESSAAKATDVISIVTLEESPQFVVLEEPTTWTLYNKIVDIYNEKTIQPHGHGPFVPALDLAHSLLTRNSNASCAMALLFLSDGKPSDSALNRGMTTEDWNLQIVEKVECLAKQFGRRLTFTAMGVGDMDDFATLESMVDAAKDYGAISHFSNPSMTSVAIGGVFTALSSTLTATQTEMTDVDTLKQHKVKPVNQESRKKANQTISAVSKADFFLYKPQSVERLVYKESVNEARTRTKWFEKAPLQHPRAKGVAFSKGPFGEGGERYAYRFFELKSDMETVVGAPLVAKESRLLLEAEFGNEASRLKFAKQFCSTQQLARRLANEFNATLSTTRRVHRSTPKIALLDCCVYKLDDIQHGKLSVLVEEKLDHEKWQKWNMNNGFVAGMAKSPELSEERIAEAMKDIDLGIIEEGSEEEDSEEEDTDDESEEGAYTKAGSRQAEQVCFTPFEVAQAFSHYTYLASGRKRLVCDLQGVYDESANLLRLSDPVIHYKSTSGRRRVHGMTDKGEKGVGMFFATHREHCGHLCKLVNRRFRPYKNRNHRRNNGGRR